MTNHKYTALHMAVEAGNPEVVECLLGHGANVHIRGGERSESPLHIACRMAGARDEKCAKMLLKSGADPNFPMLQGGDTPLHVAAAAQANAAVRILKLLLENGADIGKLNSNGESALHTAVKTCNFKASKVSRSWNFLQTPT